MLLPDSHQRNAPRAFLEIKQHCDAQYTLPSHYCSPSDPPTDLNYPRITTTGFLPLHNSRGEKRQIHPEKPGAPG